MRNITMIGIFCCLAAAGCTGTKISEVTLQAMEFQSIAPPAGALPDSPMPELWYVGSRVLYDYYCFIDYQPTSAGFVRRETIYHVAKSDDENSNFFPITRFYYTTDRSKWVKYEKNFSHNNTSNPSGPTLDDLHQ